MIIPGEQGLGILFPVKWEALESFMQENYDGILILPIMILHVCGLRGDQEWQQRENLGNV